MRPVTIKREPSRAERAKRAAATELANRAFVAFIDSLPEDRATRRWACERMTRLTGAQVALDHGEAALHSALNGAVVAAAPAFTADPRRADADALFRNGEE